MLQLLATQVFKLMNQELQLIKTVLSSFDFENEMIVKTLQSNDLLTLGDRLKKVNYKSIIEIKRLLLRMKIMLQCSLCC